MHSVAMFAEGYRVHARTQKPGSGLFGNQLHGYLRHEWALVLIAFAYTKETAIKRNEARGARREGHIQLGSNSLGTRFSFVGSSEAGLFWCWHDCKVAVCFFKNLLVIQNPDSPSTSDWGRRHRKARVKYPPLGGYTDTLRISCQVSRITGGLLCIGHLSREQDHLSS
jgi:hypothetical protein